MVIMVVVVIVVVVVVMVVVMIMAMITMMNVMVVVVAITMIREAGKAPSKKASWKAGVFQMGSDPTENWTAMGAVAGPKSPKGETPSVRHELNEGKGGYKAGNDDSKK
jgi:hypothetical protein